MSLVQVGVGCPRIIKLRRKINVHDVIELQAQTSDHTWLVKLELQERAEA
jgi:hypothetical protein